MSDLVSRTSLDRQIRLRLSHAVEESISAGYMDDRYGSRAWDKEADVWKEALRILEAEPDASDTVKRGMWVTRPGKTLSAKCSKCGNLTGLKTAFCPGCGADMRRGKVRAYD